MSSHEPVETGTMIKSLQREYGAARINMKLTINRLPHVQL
jgi:hypothetical protein